MEKDPPYDCTALFKSFLVGETSLNELQLQSLKKVAEKGIELILDRKISKILASREKIIFEGGNSFPMTPASRLPAALRGTGSKY